MATFGNLSIESDLSEIISELSILNESIESLNLNGETDELLERHKHTVNSFVDKIIIYYLRHLSLVGLEDLMELINSDRDAHNQLPTHKTQILNMFREGKDMIEVFFFIRCDKCKKIVKKNSEDTKKAMCCGVYLKKTETNFVVYMPLRKQISQSLDNNWTAIQNFNTVGDGSSISDAHHGEILKNILEEYASTDTNILSLAVNVDGANKYNSNKLSLWPLQFVQNYLPPHIRFLPDNILVAGLMYTEEKFDFREFMLPLIQELKDLNDDKIMKTVDGESFTFKPIVTCCVVDLPAKSKIQETIQFNGYDACTYCTHPGEQVLITCKRSKKIKKKTGDRKQEEKQIKCARYTEGEQCYPLRNEQETLEKMLVASSSTKNVDGIKDVSCLVAIEHFNIVKSIGVEYMHCVLLGLQKGLTDLFCNSRYSDQVFYISKKNRALLDKRILALKPNSEVVRKPRSLQQRSDFKASEFRSMLLYYFPICLPGCVNNVFVSHVRLLSTAVYILLRKNIAPKEIDEAESLLFRFVKQHQELFGKEHMVTNVHLLKHLANSVRSLGPLWCQSAFAFERNNGVLLKKVKGTTHVLHQISSKYVLSKSVISECVGKYGEQSNDNDTILLGRSVVLTEQSLIVFNIESLREVNFSDKPLHVHKRIKLKSTTYTSTLYTLPKKSIDYFIGLHNGMIGKAKFYFESNNKTFVVIEEFEVMEEIAHFLRIQPASRNIMAQTQEIQRKFIYLKVGLKQFITSAPNPYEKE